MYDLPQISTRMGGQEIVLCLPQYIAPDIEQERRQWASLTLVELTALAEIRQARPDRDSLLQAMEALTMHMGVLTSLRLAIAWAHEGVGGTVKELSEAMGTSITTAQRLREDARVVDHAWITPTEETKYQAALEVAADELDKANRAGDAERVAAAARTIVELGGTISTNVTVSDN